MKIYSFLLLLIAVSLNYTVYAQSENADDSSAGVVIHADPRLAVLSNALVPKINASQRGGMIRSGRGYRVQLYNGNDRHKATNLKIDFIRRFPSIPTYMTYIQPQFRLKVGNFRTRNEAKAFLDQINNLYSPIMIVPDIIVINTFKDDSNNQGKN